MWQCPVSYSQAEFCEAVRNLYPRLGSVVGFTVWILTENRKVLERIPDQVGIGNTSPVRIYFVFKDKTRLASLVIGLVLNILKSSNFFLGLCFFYR